MICGWGLRVCDSFTRPNLTQGSFLGNWRNDPFLGIGSDYFCCGNDSLVVARNKNGQTCFSCYHHAEIASDFACDSEEL